MAKLSKRKLSRSERDDTIETFDKNRKKQIFKILAIMSLAILCLLTAWLGFINGHINYAAGYLSCGGKKPIAVMYYFASSNKDYYLPGDENYPGPNLYVKYVCSEKEAIDLGAKHVPYGERTELYDN